MMAAVASQSSILHMLTFTTSPEKEQKPRAEAVKVNDGATNHPMGNGWWAVAVTCLTVLLHAVAAVVELGESGGQLVYVVAQRVEQQVLLDLQQDLREAEDALPQLPLLLVVQQDLRGLRLFPQSRLVEVRQSSDGPAGSRQGC